MTDGEPAALRRHRRRPWWWLAITAGILGTIAVFSVRDLRADDRHRQEWPTVVARVPQEYEAGRHRVPIVYEHPVTSQGVVTSVVVVREEVIPVPGGRLVVAPDPANPDRVVIPADAGNARDLVVGLVSVSGAVLAGAVARWIFVARMRALATSSRPSFAMVGALRRGGLLGRQVLCSLYALDARAGDRPMCTFAVLTTNGLPIEGAAFPVEVRGRPVPGGLLVARVGQRTIWPARRPLATGSHGRPDEVIGPPPQPSVVAPPQQAPLLPWWRACSPPGVVLGLLALVGTVVLAVHVIPSSRASDRIRSDGIAVVALLTGYDAEGHAYARYTRGDSPPVETRVAADGRRPGRRYPAHVDPDDPTELELDAEPYDATTPIGFTVAAWAVAALAGWPRLRWWRQARAAAASGPWFEASTAREGDEVGVVVPPGSAGAAAFVRGEDRHGSSDAVTVAGSLDPGEGLALTGPVAAVGPAYRSRSLAELLEPVRGRVRRRSHGGTSP